MCDIEFATDTLSVCLGFFFSVVGLTELTLSGCTEPVGCPGTAANPSLSDTPGTTHFLMVVVFLGSFVLVKVHIHLTKIKMSV